MFKRILPFTVLSIFVLSLAGCGGAEEPKKAEQPAKPDTVAKPEEEAVPVYEITKDDITSHAGWTSRNISFLGVKLGDKFNDVQDKFGPIENSRTFSDVKEYLTIHQNNGLFVYTFGPNNRIRKVEIYDTFAKKTADEKLKKLLSGGDLKYMRTVFGMEEGDPIKNDSDPSAPATEYSYDSRGFRFVQFKIKGKSVNAIRFVEMKKAT